MTNALSFAMKKTDKLTPEQEKMIAEYYDKYFQQATSTEPANRSRAEKAALRLAEIGGVKVAEIKWENSPEDCSSLWASLNDSLETSRRVSIWNSLSFSLGNAFRDSLGFSLWNALRASLSFSLWNALSASLRDYLWDSLLDTWWLAFYTYVVDVLDLEISDEHRELMRLYNEIAASCFGIWILPGTIILCERPVSVEIEDWKLVDITWRK